MFPLKYPLKTPSVAFPPKPLNAALQNSDLELSDDYIASLVLQDANEAKKRAEKYGVMSYLWSTNRPERRETPNTNFLAKVVKSTIGLNEYQDRKEERERTRAEELRRLKRRRSSPDRGGEPSRVDLHDRRHAHSPRSEGFVSATSRAMIGPAKREVNTSAHKGRGACQFNPNDPDQSDEDKFFESLPPTTDDPAHLQEDYDKIREKQQENLQLRKLREEESSSTSRGRHKEKKRKEKKERKGKKEKSDKKEKKSKKKKHTSATGSRSDNSEADEQDRR